MPISGSEKQFLPHVAIIDPNTLTCFGLRYIIEKMMPGVMIHIFSTFKEMEESDIDYFFHYFISATVLMDNSSFFIEKKHQTIVLIYGNEGLHFPKELHLLNVCEPEKVLVKNILRLAEAHHKNRHRQIAQQIQQKKPKNALTKRETDVLKLIVAGNINKEIAAKLNVNLSTIITHRKNIMAKLKTKSVSSLTIYAVTHGLVRAEDI